MKDEAMNLACMAMISDYKEGRMVKHGTGENLPVGEPFRQMPCPESEITTMRILYLRGE